MQQRLEAELQALVNRSKQSCELSDLVLACFNERNLKDIPTKRYRWANLTFAACEFVSGRAELALTGAVAMELFALAADILDDLQDEDNDDMLWRKIPASQAMIIATNLLVLCYEALSPVAGSDVYNQAVQALNHVGLRASDGQFQETLYDQREQPSLDEYLELIANKSGSLTAAACKIGAIFGGAAPETVERLEQFGIKLGQIAQIANDVQDFLNTDEKSDLVKGKKTLPFVYLLTMLEGDKAEAFKRLALLAQQANEQFGSLEKEQLSKIMVNEGAAHYCLVVQEMFRQDALNILDAIPVPNKQKGKLSELV